MLLTRLQGFKSEANRERESKRAAFKRPFSMFSSSSGGASTSSTKSPPRKAARRDSYESGGEVLSGVSPRAQMATATGVAASSSSALLSHNNSNSSWAEMEPQIIGQFPVHPLTLQAKQVFVVRMLTPLAEYQEVRGI